MKLNILIVDDEPGLRRGLNKILTLQDYQVFEAPGCLKAREIIKENDIDLVLLDLKLGKEDGFQFLKDLKSDEPLIPVIVITGFGNIKNAVECMKEGAINYITKPVDKELLLSIIRKEIESSRIKKENISLKESLEGRSRITFLKSSHSTMNEIDFIINRIKDSQATVLILGESGTGKELTAKSIHYSGIYRNRPFIDVNCAALNDNLLESELFGHERGSFTGAVSRKLGRFELAGDGTLFLDEVGDMSLAMQAKLLRVLQERRFERVGGTKSIRTNCRIIAASNKELKALIDRAEFREDLYYRLSLIVIQLPPLRERKCDIEPLIQLFIDQANREYNRNVTSASPEILEILKKYQWPGNIRQLKNAITNAVILNQGDTIEKIDLFDAQSRENRVRFNLDFRDGLKKITSRCLNQVESELISRALSANNGNLTKTARELDITRKTLYEKIRKYNL